MKKMCAKCGGSMKKGGTVKKVKKMAQGGQMYGGIPQTGPTGPNIQGVDTMKRGGKVTTRKKMGMGGMHMMPDGTMMKDSMMKKGGPIIKSKKVRDVSLNTFGDSYAKTTRTKRDGSTVTKSVDTTRGYVPSASKTKTVTNKAGNATKSTKSIDYNKAVRKQLSTGKKAGRNPEDEVIVDGRQKGGAVKKMSKGGSLKPVPSGKVGLSKLPTAVRNKMGYQKKGGAIKRK
jgi:hypothetical protein